MRFLQPVVVLSEEVAVGLKLRCADRLRHVDETWDHNIEDTAVENVAVGTVPAILNLSGSFIIVVMVALGQGLISVKFIRRTRRFLAGVHAAPLGFGNYMFVGVVFS